MKYWISVDYFGHMSICCFERRKDAQDFFQLMREMATSINGDVTVKLWSNTMRERCFRNFLGDLVDVV